MKIQQSSLTSFWTRISCYGCARPSQPLPLTKLLGIVMNATPPRMEAEFFFGWQPQDGTLNLEGCCCSTLWLRQGWDLEHMVGGNDEAILQVSCQQYWLESRAPQRRFASHVSRMRWNGVRSLSGATSQSPSTFLRSRPSGTVHYEPLIVPATYIVIKSVFTLYF